jgi:hypothetical protein
MNAVARRICGELIASPLVREVLGRLSRARHDEDRDRESRLRPSRPMQLEAVGMSPGIGGAGLDSMGRGDDAATRRVATSDVGSGSTKKIRARRFLVDGLARALGAGGAARFESASWARAFRC